MRNPLFIVLICMGLIYCAQPLSAAALPTSEWQALEPSRVMRVIDGDTFVTTDGFEIRLLGLQAPKLSLGREHIKDWPLANEAKAYLEKLLTDQRVEVWVSDPSHDVHGRLLAQVVLPNKKLWLNQHLVEKGYARFYAYPNMDRPQGIGQTIAALKKAEDTSRAQKSGLWALPYYQIQSATSLDQKQNQYVIVKAIVKDVKVAPEKAYLNFGDDWKSDFTIEVTPPLLTSRDWTQLKGKTLQARGWISYKNGPNMLVNHPQQLD